MPTVNRVGKKWRSRANVDGGQISAGMHPTKAEALAAALEIERKAKAGNLAGAHGKLFRDLLERYAERVSPTKRSGGAWASQSRGITIVTGNGQPSSPGICTSALRSSRWST